MTQPESFEPTLEETPPRTAEPDLQRQSRARLDSVLRAAGMVGWEWDVERNLVHYLGDVGALIGSTWTSDDRFFPFIHPQDRSGVAESLRRAWLDDAEHRQEFRIIGKDGGVRWVTDVGRPSLFPDGRRWMSGVLRDVTARKTAELHRDLLVNELNHRVKNTLAVIQGIAAQTFRSRNDEAARIFEGRLLALSAAHNVVTRESWESAGLHGVIEDAVRPFATGEARRIRVAGPDLRAPPKTALAVAMAVHELGSNAVKYGALSTDNGLVDLRWSGDDDRLRLTWSEMGGPPVKEPTRRGFGSRMIERGLAAELGGVVKLSFKPEGVLCQVDAPLPRPAAPESKSHV